MSTLKLPEHPLERPGVPLPELGSRQLFPDLAWDAYLGHAAISPVNRATQAALTACVQDIAEQGAGAFLRWDLQRKRLREALAQLIGAEEEQIALTPGTTRGVTDIALGLPLQPGDVICTFEGEFPANVTPWQLAAERAGAEIRLLPAPDLSLSDPSGRLLENLEAAFTDKVRCVAVSAVQFQTGFRMPLAEMSALCHRFGAWIFVDAIQALGVSPLSVEELGIDALVGGAHKWLLGMEGAGFLYVRPELRAHLQPLTAGWLSHEEGDLFLFRGAGKLRYDRPLKSTAQVFDGSSNNVAGFAALEAGLAVCTHLGPEAIYEHVQAYLDEMEPLWVERGFHSLRAERERERSTILSLAVPQGVQLSLLVQALRERKVMVSSPDGFVRLAPHFANSRQEMDVVVAALDEALPLSRIR